MRTASFHSVFSADERYQPKPFNDSHTMSRVKQKSWPHTHALDNLAPRVAEPSYVMIFPDNPRWSLWHRIMSEEEVKTYRWSANWGMGLSGGESYSSYSPKGGVMGARSTSPIHPCSSRMLTIRCTLFDRGRLMVPHQDSYLHVLRRTRLMPIGSARDWDRAGRTYRLRGH